jgi:hypothetical protein
MPPQNAEVTAARRRWTPQIGNRAMGRLFAPATIQAKLMVSSVGDAFEEEADRVADAALSISGGSVGTISGISSATKARAARSCSTCDEEALTRKDPHRMTYGSGEAGARHSLSSLSPPVVQYKCAACVNAEQAKPREPGLETIGAHSSEVPAALETGILALKATGRPLPNDVRAFLEPRLEADLSAVRVHTDGDAGWTAQALRARAFTVGHDVVFAPGQYAPHTRSGRWLLAHELTHVVQQTGGTSAARPMMPRDSVVHASGSAGGRSASTGSTAPAPMVQRDFLGDVADVLNPSALLGKQWLALDNRTKIRLVDMAISLATAAVDKFPGKLLMGGLWEFVKEGLIAFYQKLKTADVDVKVNAVDKLVRILSGKDDAYTLAYLKGVAKGFFVDGALGIFIAVWDLVKALGKLWDFIKGIGEAIGRFPEEIENLLQRFLSVGQNIGANIGPAIDQFTKLVSDPQQRGSLLSTIVEKGKGLAKEAGGKIAESLLDFFSKPEASAEIGETVGGLTGQVLWEVVFAALTAGGGAAVTAAKTALREAAGVLGKLVGRVVTGVLKVVAEIRTAMGKAVEWVKGAIKAVKGKLSELGGGLAKLLEDVGEFFAKLLRNCHESKLVCEFGEAVTKEKERAGLAVELTERQAQRLRRVSEALKDETKWGDITPKDRFRLGRVYDKLLENLVGEGIRRAGGKVLHYVELDAVTIAKLRASGERVLVTEGRLSSRGLRFDMLEIDFAKGRAELIDIAATSSAKHLEKTRSYKSALERLLKMPVEAKELLYTGPNGELLDTLKEVPVK